MMLKINNFPISLLDYFRSRWNQITLTIRNKIAFSRQGYYESCALPLWLAWKKQLDQENQDRIASLEQKFHTENFLSFLSLANYKKNIATLWILEQFSALQSLASTQETQILAYDVGCQDFSRAPALHSFLKNQLAHTQKKFSLIGIELDAFPILRNCYSRFDFAQYFSRFFTNVYFIPGNFFLWKKCAYFVSAFYPFVSPHPALAWGIPLAFGDATLWIQSIAKNLEPGGLLLVVHQGNWEEAEFDEAREKTKAPLKLLERRELICPFYPNPFPMHASVYKKTRG